MLHDIGKIDTGFYRNGEKTFPNHELRGAELSKDILQEFDLTNGEKKEIIEFIKDHTEVHTCLDGGINEFQIKIHQFRERHSNSREFIVFCLSDIYGSYLEKSNKEEYLYRVYTLLNVI